ncbi:MAG: penicillin-binding protein 1B [Deltaproteobacteria bacterium]|nr:penicillin-binding protein 1B [Deltaproteobacteria bacterium]
MFISKKTIRILVALLLVVCVIFGYGVYHQYVHFNQMVLERFQGRLWELPARVYARPMSLYPGMRLNTLTFEQALNRMGYQQVKDPKEFISPGRYFRKRDVFTLFRRPFKHEKETHASGKIQIKIQNSRVLDLQDVRSRESLEMVRLSPLLIGSFYPKNNEDRVLLTLKDTPPLLAKALIAVEDRSFHDHHGVVPLAILRALLINIREGHASQGGSTISQQLAKNFFLTPEKSIKRKLDEIFVAVAMERKFSKEEILETYLNEVYLGQDGKRAIHGFGLASSFYFGKSINDLKPHEIALLVGILKGPSRYNPRKHPGRAISRRNTVLDILRDQGILSPETVRVSRAAPLGVIEEFTTVNTPFPAYLDLVKRQLLQEYRESDLRSAGLRIFTTLDLQVQLAAEEAVFSQLSIIEANHRMPSKSLEAAVVVTATGSNEVLALVGGRKDSVKGFNRALDATRPIGSLIKPPVFLTALNDPKRYTLVTPINDGPVTIQLPNGKSWTPKNYDRKHHGTLPLYQALVHSYNSSTVRLGMDLGLEEVYDTLRKMGFKRNIQMYPASLLGAIEMSPIEVAQIYQTLASGGFYSPIRTVRSIYTSDGSILQRYPLTIKQNLDAGPIYLLNKTLQTVVTEGTAKSLERLVPKPWGTAGKTGTTNDLRDSWFAGFTGSQLAVVWVGRDDNRSCGLSGATGAMRVWGRFMAEVPNAPLVLAPPENVKTYVVNMKTGLKSHDGNRNAVAIPFIEGSVPLSRSNEPSGIETDGHEMDRKSDDSGSKFLNWLKDLFK